MNLETVEISRVGAREQYLAYRKQARLEQDPVARRELEEIARAYRLASSEDLALIALTPTIEAGGTVQRTLVFGKGTNRERREQHLLPRLAVMRADARFVFTPGILADGTVEFCDQLRPWHTYRRGRVRLATKFERPQGFTSGLQLDYTNEAWTAQVPIVPPKAREQARLRVTADLSTYLTLWEVDDWQWRATPTPARDPALLRHVAADIYAVLATWDLSELERLVLTGRRLQP